MTPSRRWLPIAVVGLTGATVLVPAAVAVTAPTSPAPTATDTTAQLPRHWVRLVDVDGDGATDRVTLRPADDLQVRDGWGTGHVRIRVRFATGTTAALRVALDHYFVPPRRPWTPWFGATQIDHVRGQELVVGRTTGAHSAAFTVVTARGHRLRVLDPPYGLPVWDQGWIVNGSWGTGLQGWTCTATGVRSRSAEPDGTNSTYDVQRATFVLRLTWHLTQFRRDFVAAQPDGNAPAFAAGYGSFDCPGLPEAVW